MAKQRAKIPITQRNLVLRINQRLKPEGRMLKVARSDMAKELVGDFYVVDTSVGGGVIETNVDLEAFARKLGALSDWEELKDE